MKPAVIAKLCHQASDLYAEAMKQLQLDSIRMLWSKDWIPSVASKQAAFHALAEYFQSRHHAGEKEFGEEIARLRVRKMCSVFPLTFSLFMSYC
jgi:programmed cell death 6-interacting protein